jgi:pimeloyl-ACP methyl ester carboxylesterase
MTEPPAYTTGTVTSLDGTTIAYRQLGHGPGIIAVHGAMQASQNFMKLAAALADAFTVYVPDRRGRGLSGPPRDHYSLKTECDDIDALLQATGAHNVFGSSSGALIALQAALTLPAICRVAVYEPPLSINHSTPTDWVPRYDREVAQGKLGSAMVTAIRGTQTAPPLFRFVPWFLVTPLLNRAARLGNRNGDAGREDGRVATSPVRRAGLRLLLRPLRRSTPRKQARDTGVASHDDVPLHALVPTMHDDARLAMESEGTLDSFKAIPAEVLLLGGSKSPQYLKRALDALGGVLPNARRVELPRVGHVAADNTGKPELVAQELRRFFTWSAAGGATVRGVSTGPHPRGPPARGSPPA